MIAILPGLFPADSKRFGGGCVRLSYLQKFCEESYNGGGEPALSCFGQEGGDLLSMPAGFTFTG